MTESNKVQKTEMQDYSEMAALLSKSKAVILYELITNAESYNISAHYADFLSLNADSYQVIICEYLINQQTSALHFTELLKIIDKDETNWEHIKIDNREIIIAKGSHFINKLSHSLKNFETRSPQEGSFLYDLFLTYGRQVYSLNDIHLSYEDSAELLKYRFFCTPEQRVLGYGALNKTAPYPPRKVFYNLTKSCLLIMLILLSAILSPLITK